MPNPPPIKSQLAKDLVIGNRQYKLKTRIGAGGNGVVWLAENLKLGQDVVIKFPLGKHSIELEQLELEARQLANFSNRHPNILNILDVGLHSQQPFLVTQFLSRGDLSRYCFACSKTEQYLTGREIHQKPDWLVTVGKTIDFLHSNNLVHRDIKPANILFDDSFSPYLADFGLSQTSIVDIDAGESSQFLLGSIPYMAPELLESNVATPKTDQFALAVLTFEFLAGVRPFRSTDPKSLIAEMEIPPSIQQIRPQAPFALDGALKKGLCKEPADRFVSCDDFVLAVTRNWFFNEESWSQKHTPKKPLPLPIPTVSAANSDTRDNTHRQESESCVKEAGGNTEVTKPKSINLDRLMRKRKKRNK